MTNPYREAGRVAEGDRFIGRARLVRQVAETWHSPGRPSNLRIVGHHRVGKTSIIHRALKVIPPDTNVITVRLNTGSQDSGMDLYRSIVRRVLQATSRNQDLLPVASAVQGAEEWYDLLEGVRTFFAIVRDLSINVLIILDEFDRAAATFSRLAHFQLLRDLVSEPDYSVGLVTVSRREIEKIETDATGGSILGGVVSTARYVGMFTEDEADMMLARSTQVGLALQSVRDEIMDKTGAHPFLLESFCKRIVEIHEATGKVDTQQAFAEERTTIETQFSNLLDAVNADTDSRGGALLRDLALGVPAAPASPDLVRLRLTGIVKGNSAFSPEFGRFLAQRTVPNTI